MFKQVARVFLSSSVAAKQSPNSQEAEESIITEDVEQIVNEDNDKTTAIQLHQLLTSHGYNLSQQTVLPCRMALGWTFRGST